jgi:Uma2 family endonuclease
MTSYQPEVKAGGQPADRGEFEAVHSFAQGLIAAELGKRERFAYRTFLAPSVRGEDSRILVPDICVVKLPSAVTPVLDSPHLIVEVLCPGDQAGAFLTKILDYCAAAIPHIWIVDPYTRTLFDCSGGRVSRAERERLETPLVGEIDFGPLFAEIQGLTTPASRSPRP